MAGKPVRKKSSKKSAPQNNNQILYLGIGGAVAFCFLVGVIAFQLGKGNSNPSNLGNNSGINNATVVTNTPSTVPINPAANNTSPDNVATASNVQPVSSNSASPTTEKMPAENSVTSTDTAMNNSTPMETVDVSGTKTASTTSTDNSAASPTTTSTSTNNGQRTKELSLPDLIELVQPSVVKIETQENGNPSGLGSGYVVSEDGIIVTNHHVMRGATSATANFKDGTSCKVLGYYYDDHYRDICIIKIELPKNKLSAVSISDTLPREGINVVGFGSPIGLSFTTSNGIISAVRTEQQFQKEVSDQHRGTWLQTTTPISPGNSGGPLVDMMGNVVGMNTMQMTIGQNLNFAISCVEIRDAIKQASGLNLVALSNRKIEDKSESVSKRIAIDYEGTPKGFKFASKIKNVAMLMASAVVDPTDLLTINFVANAESALSKANINVIRAFQLEDANDALLFMILYIDIPKSNKYAAGTQEFHAVAFLLAPDEESKKLVKVWESPDTILGYVSIESAITGNLPGTFKQNTSAFFASITSSVKRARREWDKYKDLSPEEFAKVQKEKEQELIKKKQGEKKTSNEKKDKDQIFSFKLPGEEDSSAKKEEKK